MKAAALSVFAPAGGIGVGALLQQALISLWPTAQTHSIGNVTLDSYFGLAAMTCLSLWIGWMIKRSAPPRAVFAASFLFPLILVGTNAGRGLSSRCLNQRASDRL
jgi:hypothetical protein